MNRSVWKASRLVLTPLFAVTVVLTVVALRQPPQAALAPTLAQPRIAAQPGAAGPFSMSASPVIAWAEPSATDPFRLEVALDEEFTAPLLRAVGRGPGVTLPAGSLTRGRRYFMRLATGDCNGGWSEWSRPAWFVSDHRFIGHSQISLHHYPFGKASNHNLIRDRRGRLHLVFAALADGQREIYYALSEDSGNSWNIQPLPREIPGHHVNYPSLALDPAETTAYVAWSEGERFPGRLVSCALDISQSPVVCRSPRTLSTESTRTCLCTMPAMAIGTDGVVHAMWQVGFDPRSCDVGYANSRIGWGQVTMLHSLVGNGVGPVMRLDAAGAVHVLWEGGQYRCSRDGGTTWAPPLHQPPLALFEELAGRGLRPRHCSLALSPDRVRLYAVTAAEDAQLDSDGLPQWTGPVNVHSIWLRELAAGVAGPLELVHEVSGRCATLDEARVDPVGIHFLTVPSLSTSEDGALACAWQEVEIQASRKVISAHARFRRPDGGWNAPFAIGSEPASATVSPLLAPHFGEELDVVWCESGHYDWRTYLGNDVTDDFPLYGVYHGIFVSRFTRDGCDARGVPASSDHDASPLASWSELEDRLPPGLTCRAASTGGQRVAVWQDDRLPPHRPDAREHLPNMVTLARPSARCPSYTATPTVTPTPTPAPQGTRLALTIAADAMTRRDLPTHNYAHDNLLVIYEEPQRIYSFVRPRLEPDPAVNVTEASLELYGTSYDGCTISIMRPLAAWSEQTITWDTMPDLGPSGIADSMVWGTDYHHFDVTYVVRDWLAGAPNYGVCLIARDNHTHADFESRETGTIHPPLLVLYYVVNTATPEPTGAASSTPTPLPGTPTPTPTPGAATQTPTMPAATPTPNPDDLTVDLVLNSSWFTPGDLFQLSLGYVNAGSDYQADQYIILDVYGEYYFWPSWGQTADSALRTVQSGSPAPESILDFTWPPTDQTAAGIRFWAGVVLPGTTVLLGYDMAEFGFGV